MKAAGIREFATYPRAENDFTSFPWDHAQVRRPFSYEETYFIAGQNTLRKESINCSLKGLPDTQGKET